MPDCPFCLRNDLLYGEVLLRGELCYVVTSEHPVLEHAVMVIPRRHVATPFEMTAEELADGLDLMKQAKALLDEAEPDGYTIGWNVGAVGGQEVMHAHLHVIARFADEPLAGKGLRHHLKSSGNRRPVG